MRAKRILLSIGWELTAVALLVVFVVLLATLPTLQVQRDSASLLGYSARVDTRVWSENISQYLETVRSGSLGKDRHGWPVGPLLATRLANSMKLFGIAAVSALVLGVLKGVRDFTQMRRSRMAFGPLLTGIVQGLPDFVLIMSLQWGAVWLSNRWGLRPLPVAYNADMPAAGMVYPLFCLTLVPWAYVARMTSTAMQTVYDQDFVRTARAKGVGPFFVVYRHAFRAALVQILDGLPNALAVMLSNLLLVEVLFRYPGITILIRDAVNPLSRLPDPRMSAPPPDVPVLVAAGVSLGLIFTLLHVAIAVARRLLDPRLKERDSA